MAVWPINRAEKIGESMWQNLASQLSMDCVEEHGYNLGRQQKSDKERVIFCGWTSIISI